MPSTVSAIDGDGPSTSQDFEGYGWSMENIHIHVAPCFADGMCSTKVLVRAIFSSDAFYASRKDLVT